MWESRVQSLASEDPLEREMATHSSTLAWRIPWTEEPGGLQSMGSQGVRHDWVTNTLYTWYTCYVCYRCQYGESQFLRIILLLCAVLCLATQSCPSLCDPVDCSLPDFSDLGGFSRQEYWSGLPCSPPGDLPNPGMELRCPTLQVDSLPFEPPGKPNNTGVGSLSHSRNLSDSGIEPGSPALQGDSLPADLPRKPILHL